MELGLGYLAANGFDPARAVMIGDTLHDAEVARAMGVGCVLQCAGHQPAARLRAAGVPLADDVPAAAALVLAM